MNTETPLEELITTFIDKWCVSIRNVSTNTMMSNADTLYLLLRYAGKALKCKPSVITVPQLTSELVCRFLDYLEVDRKNSIATRNIRRAGIRAFCVYILSVHPEHEDVIGRIMRIPKKRCPDPATSYLPIEKIAVLVKNCDLTKWVGRRDAVMLEFMFETGARSSEVRALRRRDLVIDRICTGWIQGKGAKPTRVCLSREASKRLKAWLREDSGDGGDCVFRTRGGAPLSRDVVEQAVARAKKRSPELTGEKIHPHVFRHSRAMDDLRRKIPIEATALALGHKRLDTTYRYLHSDPTLQKEVLAMRRPLALQAWKPRKEDPLLKFLRRRRSTGKDIGCSAP